MGGWGSDTRSDGWTGVRQTGGRGVRHEMGGWGSDTRSDGWTGVRQTGGRGVRQMGGRGVSQTGGRRGGVSDLCDADGTLLEILWFG
jgi:hypothetical protein